MQVSERGIDMIVAFEGLEQKAYKCPAGVWTIGVGHTGDVDGVPVGKGMYISQQKAMELLREDLARFEKCMSREPFAKRLQQNQFDALVSFVFNVGAGAFHTSTMRKKLLAGADNGSVAGEFSRWVYGTDDGKRSRLPGLVRRREIEAAMFLEAHLREVL